jgi:dTDP-4-dehydrorhamnose reductase
VTPGHFFWERLEWSGLADRARAIADDPCPPDVIGVNHYLTSERFLDHRFTRYPEHTHGGNYERRYADVEAVRVLDPGPMGLERLLEMTWERYGLPVAVTESHNGCTREEQMRWTYEAWVGAQRLRERGVPVQAVTVWALLGGYDWHRLLTVEAGVYECGAYDVRGGEPRPTGMIGMMRTLSTGQGALSPVLSQPGWWRREIRHAYPTMDARSLGVEPTAPAVLRGVAAPVLITGRTGTLGRFTAEACEHRALDPLLTDRRRMRIEDPASVAEALDVIKPWAVVNTAGWVRVDDAEDDPTGCMAANADGAAVLAEACAERGIRLVTFSSDLVFDGRNARPYVESDAPNPLASMGGARRRRSGGCWRRAESPWLVRTAAFFSASDPHNFAVWAARELAAGRTVRAAGDCTVSPTFVPDLVRAALDLLIDGETGIRHLANGGAVTWAEFAVQVAQALGLDAGRVQAVPASAMGWKAVRPANAALGTERGQILPSFEAALERFAHDFRPELEIAPSPPARLPKPAARARPTVN